VTTVDVIIPTYGRAGRLRQVVHNIVDTTPPPLTVTLVIESEDLESLRVATSIGPPVRTVVNQRTANYAGAINTAVETSEADFWFAGADDLNFHHGWLKHCLAVADDRFWVIGTNDLLNPFVRDGLHATHYLVDRRYTDQIGGVIDGPPGVALFEGYDHQYVDTEFVGAAKARVRFRPCLEAIVEHMHVSVGKNEPDATDERAHRRENEDRAFYMERRRLWTESVL
jgi:hypothetical protein